MTPREAINKLVEAGYPQPVIVSLLEKESKVVTTQPTISRIQSGAVENPMFELGQALVALCIAKTKKGKKAAA